MKPQKSKGWAHIFVKFLRDNNAVIPFCINLAMYRNVSLSKYMIDFHKSPIRFISYAFDWTKTTEKYTYWSSLNIKWYREINK